MIGITAPMTDAVTIIDIKEAANISPNLALSNHNVITKNIKIQKNIAGVKNIVIKIKKKVEEQAGSGEDRRPGPVTRRYTKL